MSRLTRGALPALLLFFWSAGAGAGPQGLARRAIVDLTHSFNAQTVYWPTSPSGFELKQLSRGETRAGYFYAANSFCAPEHGGTHIDAPLHFAEGRLTVDEIPLARLVGPAVVIDVSEKVGLMDGSWSGAASPRRRGTTTAPSAPSRTRSQR